MGLDYDKKVNEFWGLLLEHYDLETLHHYDFYISDLEFGIEHFIKMNFTEIAIMLKEGGHLG